MPAGLTPPRKRRWEAETMAPNPRHLLRPDPVSHDHDGKAAYAAAIERPEDTVARIETDRAIGQQMAPTPAKPIAPATNVAAEVAALKAENALLQKRLSALAKHLKQLADETAPLIDPEQAAARARMH